MKTIRWGIIGCGDVTEVKSGPGFQKAENSRLVAVMRRNGALAKDYAERHSVPKWYDNADTLIGDPDVNAIYIATPPDSHKAYTLAAAAAGKPVYVEKPMALNYAECEEMVTVCREAGVPLFVAYYRRQLPRFLKVKSLLDGGAIGQVRLVMIKLYQPPPKKLDADNLPWRLLPEIAGAGLFYDLASHTLDLLDYLLGPIRLAHGFAHNQARLYPAEDIVCGSFVFESGVQGVGSWCFSAFESCDVVDLIGDKGKLTFSTFSEAPVVLATPDGETEFSIDHPPHVQQPLIQSIVDELNGQGTCPSSGESGARANWVMGQMLAGYRSQHG
jgi:predicted dehydrogenase